MATAFLVVALCPLQIDTSKKLKRTEKKKTRIRGEENKTIFQEKKMKMSENGIRPQFVATLFFMLLGISALLFGVIYLLFAPKRLDPRVVEYNRVVDSWTSTNRKEFESFTFNLTLLDVQNSPNFPYRPQNQQQFQLSPDTTVCISILHSLIMFSHKYF